MTKLQEEHKCEITAYLVSDPSSAKFGFFIQEWSGATESSDISIPEVSLRSSNSFSKNSFSTVSVNQRDLRIFAIIHTHPNKVSVPGAPPEFANTPSFQDAFVAGDGGVPNYVFGPTFISRVSGKDAASVELNTMPKNPDGSVAKFVSDYYKIADLHEVNSGTFKISDDAIVRDKRRTIKHSSK